MFLAFRSLIAGPSPVNIKVTGRASQVGSTNSFRIYGRNLDPLSQRIDEGKEKRAVQLEAKQRQQKERKTNERAKLRERQRSVRAKNEVFKGEMEARNKIKRLDRQVALSKMNESRDRQAEKWRRRAEAKREARLQGKKLVAEQKVLIAARTKKRREELAKNFSEKKVAQAKRAADSRSKVGRRQDAWRSLYFTVGGSSKLIIKKTPIDLIDPYAEKRYRLFPNVGKTLGKIFRGELRMPAASISKIPVFDTNGNTTDVPQDVPYVPNELPQTAHEIQTAAVTTSEKKSEIDIVNQEWKDRWTNR